jgi:hypothetical protein
MLVSRSRQQLSFIFQSYNFKHSSTRMYVERAFGILQKKIDNLKKTND